MTLLPLSQGQWPFTSLPPQEVVNLCLILGSGMFFCPSKSRRVLLLPPSCPRLLLHKRERSMEVLWFHAVASLTLFPSVLLSGPPFISWICKRGPWKWVCKWVSTPGCLRLPVILKCHINSQLAFKKLLEFTCFFLPISWLYSVKGETAHLSGTSLEGLDILLDLINLNTFWWGWERLWFSAQLVFTVRMGTKFFCGFLHLKHSYTMHIWNRKSHHILMSHPHLK